MILGAFQPESASNIAVEAAKIRFANSTKVTFACALSVGVFPLGLAVASFSDTV